MLKSPSTHAVNPYLIAVVVSLAAFMEVLDTTIVNVALSHIGGGFSASQDESSWVITSYLVANGIVLPLSGWLASVMGRKNYFMFSIAGFTVVSLACGLSNSLILLITFRLLQGLAGGGLQPMQMSIVMDSFTVEKRGVAFGITGMTMIVAPIIGPTLGGWITDNFSWRWIFFINVPVGILALYLVNRLITDTEHSKAKGLVSIDYIGLSLVVLGLGTLQIVLDKGQNADWFDSHFILSYTIISTTCIISAIIWLLRQKDPIIDIRLIANRSFGMSCLMIFFIGFLMYGSTTLLPLLVQAQFGYNATLAGLVLSPGALVIVFLTPIVGKLVNIFQPRYLIAFGMIAVSIGMNFTGSFTSQANYNTFVLMRIAQICSLPFLFIPSSTLAFSDIPPEKSDKASALFSLLRNMGGSIGISVLLSYVSRHEQMHQSILIEHLNYSNPGYRALLSHYTAVILSTGGAQVNTSLKVLSRIYQDLLNQASVLAYADGFRLIASMTLTLACVALLMPRSKVAKQVAAH